MNIKVPKDIKNPTVIITGQQDNSKELLAYTKRIDLLENRLDKQYKMIADTLRKDRKDNTAKIFANKLDGLKSVFKDYLGKVKSERDIATKEATTERLDYFEKQLDRQYEMFTKNLRAVKQNNNGSVLKTFVNKIDSLEDAFRSSLKITKKKKIIRKPVSADRKLANQMSKEIWKEKPARVMYGMVPYAS